jgi:hypothetical protein
MPRDISRTHSIANIGIEITHTSMRSQAVTVSAGTFDTLKLQYEHSATPAVKHFVWYIPGSGW